MRFINRGSALRRLRISQPPSIQSRFLITASAPLIISSMMLAALISRLV